MNQNRQLGNTGEELVAQHLSKQGFSILVQNYTTRFGEIDLVATKDEYLLFVEVKTRKKSYFQIASVVTPSKQQKIVKSAKHFLMTHNISNKVCRFDVATVLYTPQGPEIEYIANAFYGR